MNDLLAPIPTYCGKNLAFFISFGFVITNANTIKVNDSVELELDFLRTQIIKLRNGDMITDDEFDRLSEYRKWFKEVKEILGLAEARKYVTEGKVLRAKKNTKLAMDKLKVLAMPYFVIGLDLIYPGTLYHIKDDFLMCLGTCTKKSDLSLYMFVPEREFRASHRICLEDDLTITCMIKEEFTISGRQKQYYIELVSTFLDEEELAMPTLVYNGDIQMAVNTSKDMEVCNEPTPTTENFEPKYYSEERLAECLRMKHNDKLTSFSPYPPGYVPSTGDLLSRFDENTVGTILIGKLVLGEINSVTSDQLVFVKSYVISGKIKITYLEHLEVGEVLFQIELI